MGESFLIKRRLNLSKWGLFKMGIAQIFVEICRKIIIFPQ